MQKHFLLSPIPLKNECNLHFFFQQVSTFLCDISLFYFLHCVVHPHSFFQWRRLQLFSTVNSIQKKTWSVAAFSVPTGGNHSCFIDILSPHLFPQGGLVVGFFLVWSFCLPFLHIHTFLQFFFNFPDPLPFFCSNSPRPHAPNAILLWRPFLPPLLTFPILRAIFVKSRRIYLSAHFAAILSSFLKFNHIY